MLMYLVSRLLSAWFAFLIPCYSTWKVLSHRPLSEPDVERWAMYWAVVGAFVAFENAAEWLVSWFPFYWETRTVLLLFLSLPQIQGSAFVYKSYLEPFFRKHEAEIDAGIVAAQTNTVAFAQAKLTALWETGWRIATRTQVPAGASTSSQPNSQGPPPPSAQPPNPAHLFAMGANFVQSYGQGAFGAIQRSLYAGAPQSAPTATAPSPRPSPGVQQRTPFYASSENVSRAPSSHSNTPPAFPEPYHF